MKFKNHENNYVCMLSHAIIPEIQALTGAVKVSSKRELISVVI